jgi:hypothetical protein
VDPVLDSLLHRKYDNAGNRIRALWICSQELRTLDHITSPTSGGRSVGINRLRTEDIKFFFIYIECSLCRLVRHPDHLIGRHWYLLAKWRSFIWWSPDQWVSIMPSSVVETSIVLCSVSIWLAWVSIQSACALNILYVCAQFSFTSFPVHIAYVYMLLWSDIPNNIPWRVHILQNF